MTGVDFPLVAAAFAGVSLFVLAHHFRVPAIVLLLAGGVVLGPEVTGLIDPSSMGSQLNEVVHLCVAIILFEGGLTLKPEGYRKAPRVIWMLLTVGVVVTWLGTVTLIHLTYGVFGDLQLPLRVSILAGSLVIVTGPTVIAPLLKRIQVRDRLYHILHWEGVLIDPIGVFIAILCFEWFFGSHGTATDHLLHLGKQVATGVVMGGGGGVILASLLRRGFVPTDKSNIFALGSALLIFQLANVVAEESGILAVIVAGWIVGASRIPILSQLKSFKSEVTELAISIVFILLAANLQLKNFQALGPNISVLLAGIMLLVRPVSILLCTFRSNISIKERLFLAWIAPRGVVAGSLAALFGLELMSQINEGQLQLAPQHAAFLETFTFSVIASTIVLQGLSANRYASFLGIKAKQPGGWLIVGAHDLSWKVAEYVETHSHSICVFVDSNLEAVEQTRRRGFRAEKGNALETDWLQHEDWPLFKHVLAVTDNADLNAKVCEKWAAHVKRSALHMWAPARLQHEAGFAQILWPQLKRPSEASYELRNKIALMSHKPLSLPAAMAENASICLVHGSKKNIVFGGDPETTVANVPALYYQEHDFNLQRCLAKRPSICLDGSPDGDIFSTLIHAIGEIASDLDIDLESVEIDVRTKEREFPTLIAPGVIVPHAHLINISEPACFLVRFAPDYRSEFYGDEPIRLAVVLLSPSDFPELHLIILGEIAKIFSIPANIEQLAAAKSPRDLDAILAGIE